MNKSASSFSIVEKSKQVFYVNDWNRYCDSFDCSVIDFLYSKGTPQTEIIIARGDGVFYDETLS